MNGYLNTVIVTVVVCQIAQMITHDTESYKRIVHILCALVLLLTMAQPIRWITENLDRMTETISEWKADDTVSDEKKDPLADTARAIMEHAVQEFGLDPDGMRVTLITDDAAGAVMEIQLFLRQCAYSERVRVSESMTELYGIPVYIYNLRE